MLLAAVEPNWFYSTLAQSTAALVGLAGAFLIQSLVAKRGEIGKRRGEIRQTALENFNRLQMLRSDVIVALDGLNSRERSRELNENNWDQWVQGVEGTGFRAVTNGGTADLETLPFPDGFNGNEFLKKVEERLEEVADTIQQMNWKRMARELRQTEFSSSEEDPSPWLTLLRDHQSGICWTGSPAWDRLGSQFVAINTRCEGIRVVDSKCREQLFELRSQLVPRSMYVLFAILTALLIVGVIVPMGYLSAEAGSSKRNLLAAFGLLSVGFVGYYGWEIRNLRRADRVGEADF